MKRVKELATEAKEASVFLRTASEKQKNSALLAISAALKASAGEILSANKADTDTASAAGMSDAMLDRLRLTGERIDAMSSAVLEVAALPDPIGRIIEQTTTDNGLKISKISVPMGVIGIIYESRPNVTADAAVLCLKAGSAVLLRGGKEAINSNRAIAQVMRRALAEAGFPEGCVCLVEDTSRESSNEMMRLHGLVDLLIPRGGAGLIRAVVENATVPVIETGVGNCHIYIDKSADLDMAAKIVLNAKCSRPSVCNACETLLVHRDVAAQALSKVIRQLNGKVELRGCERTREILGVQVLPATEDDYKTEFLDFILAVRVVDSLDEAILHISEYSSGHSECIVTNDESAAKEFLARVDSAAVYVNASTRFTDGGKFGLGAEIGISTQKLHARGPMGLREITSYKYTILGSGQIR